VTTTAQTTEQASPSVNPLQYSPVLGRLIRQDGVDTLGTSTQTLAEAAAYRGDLALAAELIRYFDDEMQRILDALYTWLAEIVDDRLERRNAQPCDGARWLSGLTDFRSGAGDLAAALAACQRGDAQAAVAATELLRTRVAAVHDAIVAWIQGLLADLAATHGEDAVFDQVMRTYERLWRPRYAAWAEMTPLERLQLSAEGMRGHLSGARRRGDLIITEEPDRYVMALDPCGSCGVLRRGDPDSGRPPADPAGNVTPHPWTWNRTGVSWYSVHSPIVMEYRTMAAGGPPFRPHEGCDQAGPCRWSIYKDPSRARALHYRAMGFPTPEESA
jgi:hypothetical protein